MKCSPGLTIFAPKVAYNDVGSDLFFPASFSEVCIYMQKFLNIVILKDIKINENIYSSLHFTLLAHKKSCFSHFQIKRMAWR